MATYALVLLVLIGGERHGFAVDTDLSRADCAAALAKLMAEAPDGPTFAGVACELEG